MNPLFRDRDERGMQSIVGCMLGSAIGDMMGAATEFSNSPSGGPFRVDYVPSQYGRGAYTDDTQMALAVADALLGARRPAIPSEFMEQIEKEFGRWHKIQDEPNGRRAPGASCLRGAARLLDGVSWQRSGEAGGRGAGCGTVMRAHPIACAFHHDLHLAAELARRQAQATHDHPDAIDAAAIWVTAVGLALEGKNNPGGLIDELRWRFAGSPGCGEVFDWVEGALGEDDGFELMQQEAAADYDAWDATLQARIGLVVNRLLDVGQGWTAMEAVACALVIFALCADDFRLAILVAVNMTGDTDSVGAMVGALCGIRAAQALSFPSPWLDILENRRGIIARAFGLALLQSESSAL